MEKEDEILLKKYLTEDEELRKAVEEHRKLESNIEDFNRRIYLSPKEEIEKKELQKLKLQRKDQIYKILAKYRNS